MTANLVHSGEVMPAQEVAPAQRPAKILQIFFDVNMGKNHRGLAQIAKDNGIDVKNLQQGQYVMFINNARTAMKLYTTGNVIAHWVSENQHKMDISALRYIPAAFNATGKISYNLALQKVVEERLKRHGNMGKRGFKRNRKNGKGE